ncbi:MAG: hypothetical protein Tsb002_06600 [Wenzhouxiangellaceae bacterium]
MLKRISFSNYKAFKNGEVEIRPITILLGANSVGKSSVMQLLLLLQQTALSEKHYMSALRLNGGYVSLGEGLNLIRKKQGDRSLTIKARIESQKIYSSLKENLYEGFCKEFIMFAGVVQTLTEKRNTTKSRRLHNVFSKLEIGMSGENEYILPYMLAEDDFPKKINKETFSRLVNSTYGLMKDIKTNPSQKKITKELMYLKHYSYSFRDGWLIDHFDILSNKKNEYLLTFDFLHGIRNSVVTNIFDLEYEIIIHQKIPILKKVSFLTNNICLFSIVFEKNSEGEYIADKLSSKFIEESKYNDSYNISLKDHFISNSTIFSFVKSVSSAEINKDIAYKDSILLNTIKQMLNTLNEESALFYINNTINYVSPLRAHPKRYYFLDKAKVNAFVDTLDGDAMAEILKENNKLKQQVNNWLKKFNLRVNVEHLEDVIHKLQINQNSTKSRHYGCRIRNITSATCNYTRLFIKKRKLNSYRTAGDSSSS